MSYDEKLVLRYLEQFTGEFISPVEIAKRAADLGRFKTQPGWARVVLQRLEQEKLLEPDRHGHYRIKVEKKVWTLDSEDAPVEKPAESVRTYLYWLGPKVVEADDDQTFTSILQRLATAWPCGSEQIKKAA